MPTTCNGIALLDENHDFCKINCKWTKKNAGRHPKPAGTPKTPTSRAKLKNPKSICLVMEKDHLEFINRQAMHRSLEEGVCVETNEMIREALQKAFPMPKQFDMFGARKQA